MNDGVYEWSDLFGTYVIVPRPKPFDPDEYHLIGPFLSSIGKLPEALTPEEEDKIYALFHEWELSIEEAFSSQADDDANSCSWVKDAVVNFDPCTERNKHWAKPVGGKGLGIEEAVDRAKYAGGANGESFASVFYWKVRDKYSGWGNAVKGADSQMYWVPDPFNPGSCLAQSSHSFKVGALKRTGNAADCIQWVATPGAGGTIHGYPSDCWASNIFNIK